MDVSFVGSRLRHEAEVERLSDPEDLAVPLNFDSDDKENADPRRIRSGLGITAKGSVLFQPDFATKARKKDSESSVFSGLRLRTPSGMAVAESAPEIRTDTKENRPEKTRRSAISAEAFAVETCDGFEIGEDLELDKVENEDDDRSMNSSMKDSDLDKTEDGEEEEDRSPLLMMSSLLHNRVLGGLPAAQLNLLCSDSSVNGASPSFDVRPTANQERRRFDFGKPSAGRFRRCVSLMESRHPSPLALRTDQTSPPTMTGLHPLALPFDFTSPVSRNASSPSMSNSGTLGAFKRPFAPSTTITSNSPNCKTFDDSAPSFKRLRSDAFASNAMTTKSHSTTLLPTPALSGSMNKLCLESAERVMRACNIADVESNLTGDTRARLSLPTVTGAAKNGDLKNLDCHTLANLIRGHYDKTVVKYRILDARYCYEYSGGHIVGAENFGAWDEEAFMKEFFPPHLGPRTFREVGEDADTEKREILVFHCEFSSSRGPALMRMLRKRDRILNKDTYPALHYPECYLLHEGYKAFFEKYPELCAPRSYRPMAHPSFTHEERKFHKKSKSWAAGGGGGGATVSRTGAPSRLLKL